MSRLDSIRNPDAANVPLDRDVLLASLIPQLAGTPEEAPGVNKACCFVSIVRHTLGDQVDGVYKQALDGSTLTCEQITDMVTDLNRRIGTTFCIIEEDQNKILLANRACPFGSGACPPSLCTIISNILRVIAADNLGYSRLELQQTVTRWEPGCRVVAHLNPTPEAEAAEGREYLKPA